MFDFSLSELSFDIAIHRVLPFSPRKCYPYFCFPPLPNVFKISPSGNFGNLEPTFEKG